MAAERIARHGNLMADAIISAMRNADDRVRLQGVKTAMELEHREAALRMQEDKELESASNAELISALVEMSRRMVASGAVDRLPVIEGTAVEVPAA